MQGDTGYFSSCNAYDRSVEVLCSQRAEHTYEVTIAGQQEHDDFNYPSSIVDIWSKTENKTFPPSIGDTWSETPENAFSSGGDLCLLPRCWESSTDPGPHFQQPLSLPYGEESTTKATGRKPRHAAPRTSFYYDPNRRQFRTSKLEKCFRGDFHHPPASSIKTVRQKLIEFVETEEFDEYSFLALMTLLLAHMFRLTKAVFAMCSSAHIIVSIFVCVWRFLVIKVEDILKTAGWAEVGIKCATLTMEILVIFVCVFLFFWAILLPVYHLFVNILSKILYLFP